MNAISTRIPELPYLARIFGLSAILRRIHQMRFYRIDTGDFVQVRTYYRTIYFPASRHRETNKSQFQLVPIGMRCLPMWFQTKKIPPKVEVEEGRYLYDPVPMGDVELAYIPLKHLLKPRPYSDNFWITRFPKKIRDPLSRLPGSGGMKVIGLGIRVNGSLNWAMIFKYSSCRYLYHSPT